MCVCVCDPVCVGGVCVWGGYINVQFVQSKINVQFLQNVGETH